MYLLIFLWIAFQQGNSAHVGDIRLLGGSSPLEGRMELYLGARGWFTTCDRAWDINDATVICRQLGYPGAAFSTMGTEFGRSVGKRPLARTWNCTGNERRIGQCHYEPTYPCTDVVGVICQDPSYLGCYNDVSGIFQSFLAEDYFISSSLTVQACKSFCSNIMHPIIGLKSGDGCYCGDSRDVISGHEKYPDAMCQETCSGNDRQICGGARSSDHDSISIFDVNLGDCVDPGIPVNGVRLSDWFQFSDIIKFDCLPGYRLVGDNIIQCVLVKPGDGHMTRWNGSVPVCEEIAQTTSPTSPRGAHSTATVPSWNRPITVAKTTTSVTQTGSSSTTTTTKKPRVLPTSATKPPREEPVITLRPLQPVTSKADPTVKPKDDHPMTSQPMTSSTSNTTDSDMDEYFTFYTEFFENQTELILDDDDDPRNGIFGIPEDLRTLVSIGALIVACVIAVLLIIVTKRVICRRRRAYHSLNIERPISEEDMNGQGPYVYEPLTGSGSGHYARPRRHSLRRGFKRFSRRPWSEMEESRETDDEEVL